MRLLNHLSVPTILLMMIFLINSSSSSATPPSTPPKSIPKWRIQLANFIAPNHYQPAPPPIITPIEPPPPPPPPPPQLPPPPQIAQPLSILETLQSAWRSYHSKPRLKSEIMTQNIITSMVCFVAFGLFCVLMFFKPKKSKVGGGRSEGYIRLRANDVNDLSSLKLSRTNVNSPPRLNSTLNSARSANAKSTSIVNELRSLARDLSSESQEMHDCSVALRARVNQLEGLINEFASNTGNANGYDGNGFRFNDNLESTYKSPAKRDGRGRSGSSSSSNLRGGLSPKDVDDVLRRIVRDD